MKKIKGILIDSKNLNVSEVEFEPTLEEYYRLLDCDCITAPSFNEDHDVIVDDEGLLKGPTNFFEIDGAEYAGTGMILKVNDNANFNLSLKMIVNYDMGYVEFAVTLHNKINNRKQTRLFHADSFDLALKYYDQQETMFINE